MIIFTNRTLRDTINDANDKGIQISNKFKISYSNWDNVEKIFTPEIKKNAVSVVWGSARESESVARTLLKKVKDINVASYNMEYAPTTVYICYRNENEIECYEQLQECN